MADPPMNPRLAARPTDPKRRLPVPYTQLVNPDGTANFAAIDGPKALRAAADRDCGLCGQRMGRWVAFLGGPRNVQHGGYLDPPMHVSCGVDATRLCPHLARQKVPRRPDGGDPAIVTPPGFVEDKPTRTGRPASPGPPATALRAAARPTRAAPAARTPTPRPARPVGETIRTRASPVSRRLPHHLGGRRHRSTRPGLGRADPAATPRQPPWEAPQ